MAATVAAVAATRTATTSAAAAASFHLTRTSLLAPPAALIPSLRRSTLLPLIRCSSSSSSSSRSKSPPIEFDISFGAAPDASPPPKSAASPPVPMLIPWIVRDESGNLTISSTPPASYIQSMTEAKAKAKVKAKARDSKSKKGGGGTGGLSASAPPKYSKAARRFYNKNFREPQRLSKVLAEAGVASRRNSEELIFEGKVTVNGSVCKLPQTRVDLIKDSIYVNGNCLSKKLPPKLYFALNKPKGYICSNGKESKSVISLFDDYWKNWSKSNPGLPKPRLFTVGRLDVATTGLIFVTNDGEFAQELSHPSSNLTKEYIATVEGSVHKRHLLSISEGTEIEGVHCTPDMVELLPAQPNVTRARLRITVHEGRNHEVRELVKCAGLQVHSLKRVRIGGYRLPSNLSLGNYLELKQSELKIFERKDS